MKTLILILGCLLLFTPCQAAEKRPEQGKQNQWQLEEIEKYISQRRLEIEDYYKGQLIEITEHAQAEIRMLEVADKAVYASLAEQAEVAKTVLHIDDYGYQAPWYLVAETERTLQLKDDFYERKIKKSPTWYTTKFGSTDSNSIFSFAQSWIDYGDEVEDKSSERFVVAHSKIVDRKNEILAQLEWEVLTLQQRRQYALTTGLAQLEKQLKEEALKPKQKATRGLVTGIIYSSDRPSAVVDHKIVHEGDKIHGVTVVKIYQDEVKFWKNGRAWEQKVQQKPAAYWK